MSPTTHSTRAGRAIPIILGLLTVPVLGAAWLLYPERVKGLFGAGNSTAATSTWISRRAEKGPFRIVITENGTVDSLRNSTLSNSVEGSTTIISLVPEGSKVNAPTLAEFDGVVQFLDAASESTKSVKLVAEDGREKTYELVFGEHTELLVKDRQKLRKGEFIAGDVCCELDSSTLVEKDKEQQIKVTTARANLEKAGKDIEIQETTNESNVAKARLAEDLALLSLVSYTSPGGEYQQELETVKGDIKKTEEELSINKEEYERIRDQARLGYANVNQLESARLKVTQSQILLGVNKGKLEVLQKYTRPKKEKELSQTAEDSKRETQRARLEGEALMTQMKAAYDAAALTLGVEEEKLIMFQRQIKACRLVATQAGEVVYASQKSSRGSEPVVIEEGAAVRERQAVINLPDLENMKIDARIHESKISRVMIGQPVEIEIDAIPGDPYRGRLQSISSVPIPGSWPNTDLKEYEAIVEIRDDSARIRKLKPGMTAQIRVVVEDRKEPTLQIPVQSVVSFSGHYYTYVVAPSGKEAERRELKVGDANDEYMEILDGVAEGDMVIMSPKTHFSQELAELEAEKSAEAEKNREKFDTPDRKTAAAGPGGPGAGREPGGGPGAGGPPAGGPPGAGGPGGGMRMDPKAWFESMDKNKDGVVTKDEHPRPESFDRSDENSDGKMTLEEMQKAVNRMMQAGGGGGGAGAGGRGGAPAPAGN
ncbi:MAG: efflux RND transporter periplasmic adaptor subunit [Planctomycetaceae bacterium]